VIRRWGLALALVAAGGCPGESDRGPAAECKTTSVLLDQLRGASGSGTARRGSDAIASKLVFRSGDKRDSTATVYGDDDRTDPKPYLSELEDQQQKPAISAPALVLIQQQIAQTRRWIEVSRATAMLVDRKRLKREPNGEWTLDRANVKRVSERVVAERHKPLCKGARFPDDPSVGYCTGFMIDGQRLATAAHCLAGADPAQIAIVFSFLRAEDGAIPERFASTEVRFFDGVPKASDRDLAVGRISGPPRTVYLAVPPDDRLAARDTEVFAVGYPLGMPAKSAGDAKLLSLENDAFYMANLDVTAGNSGSPVLATETGALIGVLVGGDEDFSCSRKCCRWFVCADNLEDCTGEKVVAARWLRSL
jgi:S1-C subfamily serine protease